VSFADGVVAIDGGLDDELRGPLALGWAHRRPPFACASLKIRSTSP
jgi:hypothetical protein